MELITSPKLSAAVTQVGFLLDCQRKSFECVTFGSLGQNQPHTDPYSLLEKLSKPPLLLRNRAQISLLKGFLQVNESLNI